MISLYAAVSVIIFFYFVLLFAWAIQANNFAVADIGWGSGFIITALYCTLSTPGDSLLEWLVTCLVIAWGSRLTLHIYLRNKGQPEDFRYRKFRNKWKRFTNLQAFVKLYLSQALVMILVSSSIVVAANSYKGEFAWYSWFFVIAAIVGFLYESVSDFQLRRFKKNSDNRGKIMNQGLWHYSRHPNYFGEILFWWSISLLVTVSTGQPAALISGLTMNLLIVFVSGTPMLEEKYQGNAAYLAYQRSTNSIVPRLFKRSGI
ncbi:MAG TPA: DUF1295 domain-containing protein [Gammaproteobacteria bacterium]|nr:DUF1295 domain-containing protein [Gammaproteobacteria bacterium]